MPLEMDRIYEALGNCDLFVSIGTSGNVYPAAGFVAEAHANGHAHTVELNLEPSEGYSLFDERRYGRASVEVPALERKSVVEGKSVSVRVDLGGRRIFKKKTTDDYQYDQKPYLNNTLYS